MAPLFCVPPNNIRNVIIFFSGTVLPYLPIFCSLLDPIQCPWQNKTSAIFLPSSLGISTVLVGKSSWLPYGFRYFLLSCWNLQFRIFFVVSHAKTSSSIIGFHREHYHFFWHLSCLPVLNTEGAAIYAKRTSSSHGISPSAATVLDPQCPMPNLMKQLFLGLTLSV